MVVMISFCDDGPPEEGDTKTITACKTLDFVMDFCDSDNPVAMPPQVSRGMWLLLCNLVHGGDLYRMEPFDQLVMLAKCCDFLDIDSGYFQRVGRLILDSMSDKTPEELRVMLHVETDDFDDSEKARINIEREWFMDP